jgi:hypothetical protein
MKILVRSTKYDLCMHAKFEDFILHGFFTNKYFKF